METGDLFEVEHRVLPRHRPVRDADLLYPRVGRGPESIAYGPADRSAAEPERPLRPDDPVHPDYRAPVGAGGQAGPAAGGAA